MFPSSWSMCLLKALFIPIIGIGWDSGITCFQSWIYIYYVWYIESAYYFIGLICGTSTDLDKLFYIIEIKRIIVNNIYISSPIFTPNLVFGFGHSVLALAFRIHITHQVSIWIGRIGTYHSYYCFKYLFVKPNPVNAL